MYEIALEPIPYQTVSFELENKSVTVSLRQLGSSLYASLWVDTEPIFLNLRAVNGGKICHFPSSEIETDLRIIDTIGDEDPRFDGLGTRWRLVYGE